MIMIIILSISRRVRENGRLCVANVLWNREETEAQEYV
jgi:hypothetical protein